MSKFTQWLPRGFAAAVAAGAVSSVPGAASAGEAASVRAEVGETRTQTARTEPRPWSVGVRAFFAPSMGVAGFGAGVDGAYSFMPEIAVGLQHLEYTVDQGADPQYCERCIRSGRSTVAFAEGRLLPRSWFTPYARVGAGLSHLHGQRVAQEKDYSENQVTLTAELGLDFHYEWASLRTYAFEVQPAFSELDSDEFAGLGVQLGTRF